MKGCVGSTIIVQPTVQSSVDIGHYGCQLNDWALTLLSQKRSLPSCLHRRYLNVFPAEGCLDRCPAVPTAGRNNQHVNQD